MRFKLRKDSNSENKERIEIIAISANKATIRDCALDIEGEVSRKEIMFMNCIINIGSYTSIIFGLLLTFIIPVLGLLFILFGIIFLSGSRQYKQALKDMKSFEKEEL